MASSPSAPQDPAQEADLLAQMERSFGWSHSQALDALGTYLLSTEAGHKLVGSSNPRARAA